MNRSASGRFLLPLLLLLAAALLVGVSGWGPLYNETDSQYAGATKLMAAGGSWLIPENNGSPRLVKPPLLYWEMAVAMKGLGVNEAAARLPGALALCVLVGVTFLFGARTGGPWRGFVAGSILLTFLGTFTLGRIIMPEPGFAAFIAAALYCALRGSDGGPRRHWWFLGFWLFAALASFTKGFHGLLYPLAIVGLTALVAKDSRAHWKGILSLSGFLLFIAINLPWYLFVEARYPGYLQNLFFAEQLGHLTGSDSPATNYTSVPRWQFLLLHLAWFFPWSVIGLVVWLRKRALPRFSRPDDVFMFAWAGVVLVSVLLVGERQDYYAMSMWPVVAWFLASLLDGASLKVPAAFVSLVLALGLGASFFVGAASGSVGTVAERATAWTTVTNFDGSVWLGLQSTAWLSLGGALVLALLAFFLHGRSAFLALVGVAACLCLGAARGYSLVAPYFSLAPMASALHDPAIDRLVYDGGIDSGSSLLFYTDLPVTLLDQKREEDFFARKFGLGHDRYLTMAELVRKWGREESIALVTESRRLAEWQVLLGDPGLAPSASSGTQILLRNHR